MKKISIVLLALATAGLAVSCQKEECPEGKEFTPMTINAVSEGIGTATKVEMAYKYELLWQADDRIYVTDGTSSDTFTLTDGAGSTEGTFTQNGSASFAGEVKAYYPQSLVSGNDLMWPAVQTKDQSVPMYSSKTVSGSVEDFNFSSLGSVLQIVFNSKQENVTLRSIEITDGNAALSGRFAVDADGKAIVTSTDKAGITFDLGEAGVVLGNAANYFNIAVPAGNYQDLQLVFTATDGSKCTMTGGKVNLAHNVVGRISLAGSSFKKDIPAGALPGVFSVSETKKVRFSQGNLYWDGDSFEFETKQFDFPSSWDESHISYFFWSKDASIAYAESYEDSQADASDVFFTNSTVETAKTDFTVNGVVGMYRTLSQEEWDYLFHKRTDASSLYKIGVSVEDKINCIIVAPDNWVIARNPLRGSYSEEEWAYVEADGLVCLPAAGFRYRINPKEVHINNSVSEWTSSTPANDSAYKILCNTNGSLYTKEEEPRYFGNAVRLVTDEK